MTKGLQALETLKNASTIYVGCASNIYTRYPFECNDIEKELKALEIIIKTLPAFVYAITNSKDYQDYSSHYISPIITQEEYNLLKEVLKDEYQR